MSKSEQSEQSQLHIPRSFFDYNPWWAIELLKKFPSYRFDEAQFQGGMPLLLEGEVPHVVMLWLLNGDFTEPAYRDLRVSTNLKFNPDITGQNVKRLGIFAPFIDERQDERSEKPLPGTHGEKSAIVKAQSVETPILAKHMQVAGVDYLTTLDKHSYDATVQYQNAGIEVINLTAASLQIEDLQKRGLLEGSYRNVICGIDFGNISLTKKLAEKYRFDLAIMRKWRETVGNGPKTRHSQEIIFGAERIKGQRVILMDDMIDSGGTILGTVKILLEAGAAEIIVLATHAVFSGEYYRKLQGVLANERVKFVQVTNSLPLGRPVWAGNKSLPEITRPEKKVEMLPIDDFMTSVVQTLLDSNGDTKKIRSILDEYILDQEDPYKLAREITGKKINPPERIAIYREGGFYEALPGETLPQGVNDRNGEEPEY